MASIIGLIGIGRIGGRLAANLLASGVDVIGFDIMPKPDFVAAGGKFAGSAGEVAERATTILHSLPGVDALHTVVDGIVKACGADHVVADLSTYPLSAKARARDRLAATGAVLLDCQITGSPEMLRERRGVIMVSGDKTAAERCRPIFAAAVEKQVFVGEFGAATRLKTANNLLVALNTAAAAEALALAVKAGVDPALAIEVMGSGAAQSQAFRQRAPLMAQRHYPNDSNTLASFTIYLDLIDAALENLSIDAPLARAAVTLYRRAIASGLGDKELSSIYEIISPARKEGGD
jgi:L-threonate 2-dehydrogenase